MHRLARRCGAALIWLMAFSLLTAPDAPAQLGTRNKSPLAPLDLPHESYAIYSLLMPGQPLVNMSTGQTSQWAIAKTTVNAEDINPALAPEAALQAPPEHPERFRQAVAAYNQNKLLRSLLSRRFHLAQPYVLLNPQQVLEFHSSRSTPGSSSTLQQQYSVYPGITYFTRVYFDNSADAALVYMLDWCGNLCSQSEWVYLEKINGVWTRRSGNQ